MVQHQLWRRVAITRERGAYRIPAVNQSLLSALNCLGVGVELFTWIT